MPMLYGFVQKRRKKKNNKTDLLSLDHFTLLNECVFSMRLFDIWAEFERFDGHYTHLWWCCMMIIKKKNKRYEKTTGNLASRKILINKNWRHTNTQRQRDIQKGKGAGAEVKETRQKSTTSMLFLIFISFSVIKWAFLPSQFVVENVKMFLYVIFISSPFDNKFFFFVLLRFYLVAAFSFGVKKNFFFFFETLSNYEKKPANQPTNPFIQFIIFFLNDKKQVHSKIQASHWHWNHIISIC